MKFWLASMKTLTNCTNPSSNPLYETLKMQKKLKTISASTESTDLIFKVFKKNYSSRDTVTLRVVGSVF
jgi:hypothetical protein